MFRLHFALNEFSFFGLLWTTRRYRIACMIRPAFRQHFIANWAHDWSTGKPKPHARGGGGGLDRSTMSTLVFVNIMQPKCIRLHFAFLLFVTRATCDFHPSLPVHTIPAEDHNSEHVEGFFIDCPQTRVSWEFFYFSRSRSIHNSKNC